MSRGSMEKKNRAMPLKFRADEDGTDEVRVGFGRFIDELVRQGGASSGILAISSWEEGLADQEKAVRGFAWSASPDDASYQRHGVVGAASKQPKKNIRFADFEGVVDDLGGNNQIAVYRVTLPRGGLDPWKWVGRPPPPAPEELYTGPRSDGLLSTEDIGGEYFACCFPFFCSSVIMTPLGANAIETWHTGCVFCPPFAVAPFAGGEALRRTFKGTGNTRLGTNAFSDMTFSADGTVKDENGCCYKKRPGSQKRSFQKVETRDLAGKWCSCWFCPFLMPPPLPWPLWSFCCWTTKRALNEDQYEESGLCCFLGLPIPVSEMHTRRYVNGHPTNGFFAANENGNAQRRAQNHAHWHRDPGCAGCNLGFCAKKVC